MQSKRFTPRLSSPTTIAALISPCFKKDWKGPALRCGCSSGTRSEVGRRTYLTRGGSLASHQCDAFTAPAVRDAARRLDFLSILRAVANEWQRTAVAV